MKTVRVEGKRGEGRKYGRTHRELKDESITRATVAPKPNRTLCHV